ncbi:MAG: hypothetical protein ABIM54_00950 [candidate division WOR-3 bacterium]
MPRKVKKRKLKGIRYEREVRDWLKSLGFTVFRSSASLGLFDLIAIKPSEIWFLQCKSKPPFKREVDELILFSVPKCARKFFIYPTEKDKFHLLPIPNKNESQS